jgi:hypothetical protein
MNNRAVASDTLILIGKILIAGLTLAIVIGLIMKVTGWG